MKLLMLPAVLPEEQQTILERKLFEENLQRSKLFAKLAIFFETILILMNRSAALSEGRSLFSFDFYFMMYLILTALSIFLLIFIRIFETKSHLSIQQFYWYRKGLLAVVILFISWGGIVTLWDQFEYGHIMAFSVNFMCVSILFHASNKTILIIYSVPILIVYGGLPFFQSSSDVLIGHYINLSVFLFFCWLTSRMLYTSYYTDFYNKWLLTKMNEDLEEQIKKNKEMNQQLEKANQQLQALMLTDELTRIKNRRGFRHFLDEELDNAAKSRQVTFMMMDIDFFKLYNDFYGHLEGDRVIRTVAQIIDLHVPKNAGFAARFGGEEFVVVLFDRKEEVVIEIAETIRQKVIQSKIEHKPSSEEDWVTVSIGVKVGRVEDGSDNLLEQADEALYKAKMGGRNRVMVMKNKVDN